MDSITVDTGTLKVASGDVETLATEYKALYDGLYNLVQDLVSSAWTGPDATAFQERIRGFEGDFTKMQDYMNRYAGFLKQAADSYDSASETNKTQIAGLCNGSN